MPAEPYPYEVNEYVWDRVREGPGIVIGLLEETDRFTVAEIVLPARKLGRVAHRRRDEICRYVHLLLPEDEAEAAETLVGGSVGRGLDLESQLGALLGRFAKRLKGARVERGIIRQPTPPPDAS